MTSLIEIAKKLDFKYNTFLYWLNKNKKDFAAKKTKINLESLYYVVHEQKKSGSKHYVISDDQLFVNLFKKYKEEYLSRKKANKENRKYNWTVGAYECYLLKGECSKCSNNFFCSRYKNPPMKMTVKKLIEIIGEPCNNV